MDSQKLREQIEFYFSDSNYAKDKFINAKAAENDGFIPIEVLLTFKRLKAMNATVESVKEAVKDSPVVELKDDSLRKVKTQEFLDYLNDNEVSNRVIYIKGFPLEYTLDEIKEYLSKYFTPVKTTLRRDNDKKFTGSCFVELKSKELAMEAIKMQIEVPEEEKSDDTSKKIKKETKYLEIMSRDNYLETKSKSKEDQKAEKFSEKVKENFIPRLYHLTMDTSAEIKDIKQVVPHAAFVDLNKKVVRMKFIEEWEEQEFKLPKKEGEAETSTIKLVKMSEEDAREYLKAINIKKTGKKN